MMKLIIMLYILFIVLFLVNTVSSFSVYRTSLYDGLRRSQNKKDNKVLYQAGRSYGASSMAFLPADQRSISVVGEKETRMQGRETWDSGEDRYFKWASLNRRPMESLTGRKRSAEPSSMALKHGRINGGIWRSGLVG